MRLVSTLLLVALTASAALADEAKPADPKPEVAKRKVPFRVVKVLPETGQVLLFNKVHATYVVAEAGQDLEGYRVEAIDEDEVTLIAENGSEVILAAAAPQAAPKKAAPKKAAETPADPAPVDPYAEAFGASDEAAPVDPYAPAIPAEAPRTPGEGGVRVASAGDPSAAPTAGPIVDAGPPAMDPGIAAFADAVGAQPAPAPKGKAKVPSKSAKPAKSHATHTHDHDSGAALASAATGGSAIPSVSAATGAPTGNATIIARSELDAALGDFSKLAGSFRASFTAEGLRFDALDDGTILTKIGLRKGDVIASVDGQPLRSLDDAANLYARASTVRNTTIQVMRAGKPVALRVAIQ